MLNIRHDGMRATEHAPSGPYSVLESGNGLAEIVERGAIVLVERLRVNPSHLECDFMALSENTSRQGYLFAHQRLGFSAALQMNKGRRVVEDCYEGLSVLFAVEL
jgi:hypothetical protein